MQSKIENRTGLALFVTLAPQDAELLRAAVPTAPAPLDRLGNKDTHSLAQAALGAIARAILREGYQPKPLGAEMRLAGAPGHAALPSGVIVVQLA
jgi:hypothetical protein